MKYFCSKTEGYCALLVAMDEAMKVINFLAPARVELFKTTGEPGNSFCSDFQGGGCTTVTRGMRFWSIGGFGSSHHRRHA